MSSTSVSAHLREQGNACFQRSKTPGFAPAVIKSIIDSALGLYHDAVRATSLHDYDDRASTAPRTLR